MANEALARRAAALLKDDDFRSILTLMKATAIQQWANTSSPDGQRREELYRDVIAVDRIEKTLQILVDGVKMDQRKTDDAMKRQSKGT